MKSFTNEEQIMILELVRAALGHDAIFITLADDLDLSDNVLKNLQRKLETNMKE